MPENTYKDIVDLADAIDSGELDIDSITAFNCKYELLINTRDGKTVFSAYYGTNNACNDISALLGLDEPEHV